MAWHVKPCDPRYVAGFRSSSHQLISSFPLKTNSTMKTPTIPYAARRPRMFLSSVLGLLGSTVTCIPAAFGMRFLFPLMSYSCLHTSSRDAGLFELNQVAVASVSRNLATINAHVSTAQKPCLTTPSSTPEVFCASSTFSSTSCGTPQGLQVSPTSFLSSSTRQPYIAASKDEQGEPDPSDVGACLLHLEERAGVITLPQ